MKWEACRVRDVRVGLIEYPFEEEWVMKLFSRLDDIEAKGYQVVNSKSLFQRKSKNLHIEGYQSIDKLLTDSPMALLNSFQEDKVIVESILREVAMEFQHRFDHALLASVAKDESRKKELSLDDVSGNILMFISDKR
jgi:hypothetical protein